MHSEKSIAHFDSKAICLLILSGRVVDSSFFLMINIKVSAQFLNRKS